MSTSITISITHNIVPGPGRHVQNKILNIHVLIIHVSETYNTIMSLHALGISVDVHIGLFDNSLLEKKLLNYILS
jgi:hypothetical protein